MKEPISEARSPQGPATRSEERSKPEEGLPALPSQAGEGGRIQWLKALRADQFKHWQRGERLRVEDYLARLPRLREDIEALLDLIFSEVQLREERGEHVSPDEYAGLFPEHAAQIRLQFEMNRALAAPTAGGESNEVSGAQTDVAPPGLHPAPSDDSSTRESLPGYEILGELGRGAMGVVYKAREVALNWIVAIKMIQGQARPSSNQRARFDREAKALARLRHPHIVQVHTAGEQDGRPYFIMEYVEGGGLDQHIGGRPQPPVDAARLVMLLARAVHAAHEKGIVHRDLKPANVLLAPPADEPALNSAYGLPKVSDFGLAKTLGEDQGRTADGMLLGSPWYMAPEQADSRPKDVGPATDVYALGVILYEMLTGQVPFRGQTWLETLEQVRSQPPRPPHELRPDVPPVLETVCLRCLAKAPADRYPSAQALSDDLAAFLSGEEMSAPPTRPPGQLPAPSQTERLPVSRPPVGPASSATRRKRLVLALAVALVVLLPLGYFFGGAILRYLTNKGKLVPVDADRRAAEWVLSVGGKVMISVGHKNQKQEIGAAGDLPAKVFALTQVNLSGKEKVTDAGLAQLKGLPKLATLRLDGCQGVSDAGLAHLKALPSLTMLYLDKTQVTDAGLAQLKGLPKLTTLFLTNCKGVSDAGLAHLKALPSLTALTLFGTRVSDAGLVHLKDLANLTQLNLIDTKVSDAGLVHLKGLIKLTDLRLDDTWVSDAGLVHLKGLIGLTRLYLNDTKVSDAGLVHLKGLAELRVLFLSNNTRVSDPGLKNLEGLTELTNLRLNKTQVSDKGLTSLSGLRKLKELDLTGTKVTPPGLAALRKALPNCKILSGPAPK